MSSLSASSPSSSSSSPSSPPSSSLPPRAPAPSARTTSQASAGPWLLLLAITLGALIALWEPISRGRPYISPGRIFWLVRDLVALRPTGWSILIGGILAAAWKTHIYPMLRTLHWMQQIGTGAAVFPQPQQSPVSWAPAGHPSFSSRAIWLRMCAIVGPFHLGTLFLPFILIWIATPNPGTVGLIKNPSHSPWTTVCPTVATSITLHRAVDSFTSTEQQVQGTDFDANRVLTSLERAMQPCWALPEGTKVRVVATDWANQHIQVHVLQLPRPLPQIPTIDQNNPLIWMYVWWAEQLPSTIEKDGWITIWVFDPVASSYS